MFLKNARLNTLDEEFNRVLGGGLVPGSLTFWVVNLVLEKAPCSYKLP